MNFIDIAILLVFAVCVLGGYYKGFVSTLLNIGATIISFLTALVTAPVAADFIRGRERLYSMLLYYTEGAEYVAATDVEMTRVSIAQVTADKLNLILKNANMPLPMDAAVKRNIAVEAFAQEGITTLGDYFNRTIVSVTINICCIVLLFCVIRILLGFFINGMDYAREGYPVLRHGDSMLGAGVGIFHAVLLLFVAFMLLPVALVVLPKLYEFVAESFFGVFFYKANFFIRMVPYA